MRTAPYIRLLALLSPFFVQRVAVAQSPVDESANCAQSDCGQGSPAVESAPVVEAPTPSQQEVYAASLNGSGPIPLLNAPKQFLFGLGFSSGWDSNPTNGGLGVASRFFIVSPYLGLRLTTPRTQTLLQYDLTAANYSSSYANQVLNSASARYLATLTDRWALDFGADASYGTNSARFLGSPQTLVGGTVQGAGAETASYLNYQGNVTDVNASLGATYQVSPRNSLRFQVGNGYTRFSGHLQTNSIATATASFAHSLSPSAGISAYAQVSHYYGVSRCDSFGVGLTFDWNLDQSTSLAASGGPQLNAPNCDAQQGAAYSVALTRKITGRSEIYALSKREAATSYLGPGLWQDSVSAGYSHLIARTGTFQAGVVYLHSLGLEGIQGYSPLYLDTSYSHSLTRMLRASFDFRTLKDLSGSPNGNRNVVLFSLNWSPDRTTTTPR